MKMWEGLPCERTDCVLHSSGQQSTLMHWEPAYDRDGNALSAPIDLNTVFRQVRCSTCGKRWQESRKGNQTPIWVETA